MKKNNRENQGKQKSIIWKDQNSSKTAKEKEKRHKSPVSEIKEEPHYRPYIH